MFPQDLSSKAEIGLDPARPLGVVFLEHLQKLVEPADDGAGQVRTIPPKSRSAAKRQMGDSAIDV